MRIAKYYLLLAALMLAMLQCSCTGGERPNNSAEISPENTPYVVDAARKYMANVEDFDVTVSDRDTSAARDVDTYSIDLNDFDNKLNENGITLEKDILTITDNGTYVISGSLDGSIVVNAKETDSVQIVLSNAKVTCSNGPAILILSAQKAYVTVDSNSDNSLCSEVTNDADNKYKAVVYSEADLTLNGEGSLDIDGGNIRGVLVNGSLIICECTINITVSNVGLCGRDCVKIESGIINISAGIGAILANNSHDEGKGFVYVGGGTLALTAGTDGIKAETAIIIDGGVITVETGGGSENSSYKDGNINSHWGVWGVFGNETQSSAKAFCAGALVYISGGTFFINSSDDCINTEGDASILGGSFTMSSGDDGIHADGHVEIFDGTIKLKRCYEGIEGTNVDISGGNITITASDDGISCAGGNDGSSINGRVGANTFDTNSYEKYIRIRGGRIVIDAGGDGIDAGGDLYVEDGTILVSGADDSMNFAIDYALTATVTGGTVVACGSTRSAKSFNTCSTQTSFMYSCASQLVAGSRISVVDANDNIIISYAPPKLYACIIISCSEFSVNDSYKLMSGGNAGSADELGLAKSGILTDGIKIDDIILSYTSTVFSRNSDFGGIGNNPTLPEQPGGNPFATVTP